MQKLVYCIWNKFCTEDDEVLDTTYILTEFEFQFHRIPRENVVELTNKNGNYSDQDESLDSLEYDDLTCRPTLHARLRASKMKKDGLDVIRSVENSEEERNEVGFAGPDWSHIDSFTLV